MTAARGLAGWFGVCVDLARGSERWRTLALCGACLLFVAAADGFRGSPAPRPSGAVSSPPPAAPAQAAQPSATPTPPVMTPIVTAPVAPPPIAIAPTRELRPVERADPTANRQPFAVIDGRVRTDTPSAIRPLR